ncbi:MAG: GH3 auxin-responsive promoter family protein [Alphaproteobacteria bacterium]|nr:GH3 auxin-responsive promoter family protein [Alphaproteobacteria bacterium]
MIDATPLLRCYAQRRARQLARQNAAATQQRTLLRLLGRAAATRFGREHRFSKLADYRAFREAVPLRRYEDFWREYWQSAFPRLADCSWPGLIPFFAATSGTSTGATKFIPVTWEMIRSNRRAALDVLVFHVMNRPASRIFGGRNLLLGGSAQLVEQSPGVSSGDISGIAAATMPRWSRIFGSPPRHIASLSDWTEKITLLTGLAPAEDIRSIAGTPSWLLLFFDRLAARYPGRRPTLSEFFPHLELVVHGGVNFAPYRTRFSEWLSGSKAELREAYPASEGFIAAADRAPDDGLRLMLDHDIFYEFVPVEEREAAQPHRHWIGEIETGVDYAVVLTTCAGLWAYLVGDTVRFVTRDPPRLRVTGRLSYMLSAFGEHLTGEEIEGAVASAADRIHTGVRDFAIGALFPERLGELGGHVLIIEFERPVSKAQQHLFAASFDSGLACRNLDYEAHRAGMRAPEVRVVPHGFFAEWMRGRGRLGAQNKVARVLNDQGLFRDLIEFAGSYKG